MNRLTGWRYAVFIGTFVGSIGLFSYLTMISPMINPEPYKAIREEVSDKLYKKKM